LFNARRLSLVENRETRSGRAENLRNTALSIYFFNIDAKFGGKKRKKICCKTETKYFRNVEIGFTLTDNFSNSLKNNVDKTV